jgi:hypothetical protein
MGKKCPAMSRAFSLWAVVRVERLCVLFRSAFNLNAIEVNL